jgi:hypothetical protein
MKTGTLQKILAVVTVAGLALSVSKTLAQDSTTVAQPAAASAAAPRLSYGVSQIVQLAQAKVGEDTIIAYIKNSGNSYVLTADQIIYLRQQGVSDAAITTMLNQPRLSVAAATTPPPAPQAAVSTATVAPAVTYVQTVPATTYYYYGQPYYYYPAYYYPAYGYYGFYPGVSLSFGWGGRWGGGWGGGWHGGWGGGWHGHR